MKDNTDRFIDNLLVDSHKFQKFRNFALSSIDNGPPGQKELRVNTVLTWIANARARLSSYPHHQQTIISERLDVLQHELRRRKITRRSLIRNVQGRLKKATCGYCKGTGKKPCVWCDGKGWRINKFVDYKGWERTESERCIYCYETGLSNDQCTTCRGSGIV